MEQTSEVSRAAAQVSYAPLVHLGGAGLGIGIATLVRPITFYLPLALGLLVAWRMWGSKRRMVTALLVLFLSYIVVVGPWLVRNHRQAGIRQISTVQTNNLLYYRAAGVLATQTGTDLQSARRQLQQAVDAELANSHSAPDGRPSVEARVALRTMLAHPVALLRMSLTSVARVVIGPGKAALFDLTGTPATPLRIALLGLETLLLIGLYLAALYGTFQLVNARQYGLLALVALIIGYFLLISSGPEAYSRFRVPSVPYIALLAGYGASAKSRPIGHQAEQTF